MTISLTFRSARLGAVAAAAFAALVVAGGPQPAAAQSPDAAIGYAKRGYSIVVTGLLPPLLRVSTDFVNKSHAGIEALRA